MSIYDALIIMLFVLLILGIFTLGKAWFPTSPTSGPPYYWTPTTYQPLTPVIRTAYTLADRMKPIIIWKGTGSDFLNMFTR